MFKIIEEDGRIFTEYEYVSEKEYESVIVNNSDQIFGNQGIYFDIKKKIGKSKQGAAIPDGYYLDLKFHEEPVLYFVEVELSNHDIYGHIGEQILRFAISSEIDKHKIKTILIEEIKSNREKEKKLEDFFSTSTRFKNVNELLDKLIFDNEVSVIIVINENSDQLTRVLSKIKIPTDVIELQSYTCNKKILHRFSQFQSDVVDAILPTTDPDDLDTIVVPAKKEGFEEVFIKENCWYAIRISAGMINKIKYIASYQVAPISAITHIAEVEKIEKYKETDKYILYFKSPAEKIRKVKLEGSVKPNAPQAPRYSNYSKILNAKTIDDLWK